MLDLIINFAPTGMIPTKEMTPHVPVTPSEIIEQVHEANEIGITLVHLHARDENGIPTYKKSIYQEIIEGVRKYCPELVLCVSLSGRNFNEFEKRSEVIELRPDMGSLTLSSLNFVKQASVNSPDMIKRLVTKMNSYGVKPELEAFDLGMINYAKYLISKGLIKPPYYFNLLFGNIAGAQADLSHLGLSINELPPNSYWALAGLGSTQFSVNVCAIVSGGGVRVGLEDNIFHDSKKEVKATNTELLRRIHIVAEMAERNIMKSKDFGNLGFYNR